MSDLYRLFIAAELPPAVKAALAETQARLRGDLAITWVVPAAMHLTLRFLGETDAPLVPQVASALQSALSQHGPLPLHLTRAGAFPNLHHPSVVWAGVAGALDALSRLQAAVEAAVAALGFPREQRPFHAHLTLGRVRREASLTEKTRLGERIRALPDMAPRAWMVEQVLLFRSQLGRAGPTYTPLERVQLTGIDRRSMP